MLKGELTVYEKQDGLPLWVEKHPEAVDIPRDHVEWAVAAREGSDAEVLADKFADMQVRLMGGEVYELRSGSLVCYVVCSV